MSLVDIKLLLYDIQVDQFHFGQQKFVIVLNNQKLYRS